MTIMPRTQARALFQRQFDAQAALAPQIKALLKQLAPYLLTIDVATPEQDMTEATDYVVSLLHGGHVALRIRGAGTAYRDLTLRSRTRYSAPTELHKLLAGKADYYLYCWQQRGADLRTADFMLIDLHALRASGLLLEQRHERLNADGTAFIALTWQQLQRAGCLVAARINGRKVAG